MLDEELDSASVSDSEIEDEKSEEDSDNDYWFCKAMKGLIHELSLGEDSHSTDIAGMHYQDDIEVEILDCGCEMNELTKRAAMIFSTRGDDEVLIPYYELYNHRNGDWLNTKFNSYNQCSICGGRNVSFNFGTTLILNDYGFVESYPQRWILYGEIRFDLDEKKDGSGELVRTYLERRAQSTCGQKRLKFSKHRP